MTYHIIENSSKYCSFISNYFHTLSNWILTEYLVGHSVKRFAYIKNFAMTLLLFMVNNLFSINLINCYTPLGINSLTSNALFICIFIKISSTFWFLHWFANYSFILIIQNLVAWRLLSLINFFQKHMATVMLELSCFVVMISYFLVLNVRVLVLV